MDAEHERRCGDDRREFDLYYRYGNERRDYSERRNFDISEDNLSDSDRVISRDYWWATEDDSTKD